MNKTLIFFKLRMRQLKSDKTALFFCYLLPVLLLICIGYPLHKSGAPKITVYYADAVGDFKSQAFIDYLKETDIARLVPATELEGDFKTLLQDNEIKHYLSISAQDPIENDGQDINYRLFSNKLEANQIENAALHAVADQYFEAGVIKESELNITQIGNSDYKSYIVTLLPGLIGMTFMIISLNGFGGVIIIEKYKGLFKNLKTIDASPIPFLAGLFLSRLFIAYSVAIAMYLVGVMLFGIDMKINFLMLSIVVLLSASAFLGVGLVLAVFSPSVDAFNGLVNVVQLPFIVLGGVFFSISTFPDWLQSVAQVIPMIHVNNALQQVFFENLNSISLVSVEILVLLTWIVLTFTIGWKKFQW